MRTCFKLTSLPAVAWAALFVNVVTIGCGDDDPAGRPDASADAASSADARFDAGGGADAGVLSPYLLVSNSRGDNVLRYDQETGAFIDELIASGSGGLFHPDLVLVRDGRLYVASGDTPEDSAILRYDLETGEFLDEFAQGGGLHRPYGFTFTDDGNLYVSSFLTDQILRYNAQTGAFIDVFAEGNAAAGGLNGPNGMTVGPDGKLYVSTQGSVAVNGAPTFPGLPSQVLQFDLASGESEVFIDQPEPLPDSAGFVSLLGLAFGPDCTSGACDLFVSDFAGGIRRYDQEGVLLDSISTSYTGMPTTNFTGNLTFGDSGNLFAVAFDNTEGSDNLGVILRYDGATGDARPASGLDGALLTDTDSRLLRPIGITAVSAP